MEKITRIGFLLCICALILGGGQYLKMRDYYQEKLNKCRGSYARDSMAFVKMVEENTIYLPENDLVKK